MEKEKRVKKSKPKWPPGLREPRAKSALPVVVFGIDPGGSSGWAVNVAGRMRECAKGDTHPQRCNGVRVAMAQAKHHSLPLVVVMETWSPRAFKKMDAVNGLNEMAGAWKVAFRECGLPMSRLLRIHPPAWQSVMFGPPPWIFANETKLMSKHIASGLLADVGWFSVPSSFDVCDAICMAEWGTRAPAVWQELTLPMRKKLMAKHPELAEYQAMLDDCHAARREWFAAQAVKKAAKEAKKAKMNEGWAEDAV